MVATKLARYQGMRDFSQTAEPSGKDARVIPSIPRTATWRRTWRTNRSESWGKSKRRHGHEVVIGGWTTAGDAFRECALGSRRWTA